MMRSQQHEVGLDTFLATTVSDAGPFVDIVDVRLQIWDEHDELLTEAEPLSYEVEGSVVLLSYTVEQARALAAAINKAADDVEVLLSLC